MNFADTKTVQEAKMLNAINLLHDAKPTTIQRALQLVRGAQLGGSGGWLHKVLSKYEETVGVSLQAAQKGMPASMEHTDAVQWAHNASAEEVDAYCKGIAEPTKRWYAAWEMNLAGKWPGIDLTMAYVDFTGYPDGVVPDHPVDLYSSRACREYTMQRIEQEIDTQSGKAEITEDGLLCYNDSIGGDREIVDLNSPDSTRDYVITRMKEDRHDPHLVWAHNASEKEVEAYYKENMPNASKHKAILKMHKEGKWSNINIGKLFEGAPEQAKKQAADISL